MASTPSVNNAPPSTGHDNQADFRADMDLLNDTPQIGEDQEVELPADETPESDDEPSDNHESDDQDEEPEEQEPEGTEEEPETEEEPQEITGHARPTVRQIKAKYPNFFKEFPDMRHMLFREGEYSRVFPTVDDAKEAQTRAEDFDKFSEMLSDGSADKFTEFLGGVKQAGSLTSMAANFLPGLYKADRDMYFQITSPIAESLIRNAYKAASQAGNENLKNAALHVAQWAFGDPEFATGAKASPELKATEVKKDPELEKEKKEFFQLKYNETRLFVQSNSRTRLIGEIRRGLDPNRVFNPTIENLLVKQIVEEVGQTLEADARHMATINSLWKQAQKAGFAGNWKDRILTTYLSRARQVMPSIRAKIRDAAVKNDKVQTTRLEMVADRSNDRREVGGGSQNSGGKSTGRPPAAREIDWQRTSDMDILNDRPTLRNRGK